MATWREALDNVRLGHVALDNNRRFTVVEFIGAYTNRFYNPPDPYSTLTVDVGTDAELNDDFLYFKNGNYFGIEYLGGNTLAMFAYIEGAEVVGNTQVSGKPCTFYATKGIRLTFDISYTLPGPPPSTITIPITVTKYSETFTYPDRQWIDQDYIMYTDYAAEGYNREYSYNYKPDFNYSLDEGAISFYGEYGYPNAQPIVDFLAGEESAPPAYPGDPSATGGGSGWYYATNDTIDIPNFPSIQAIDFGFSAIYNPSVSDMQSIARWLWSDDFEQNIKLNYTDPFNNIIVIAMVALDITSVPSYFRIGNVESEIAVPRVTRQYLELDCGSVNVGEYWAGFLDYDASYTIWLPFIGYRSIKPDDMVNGIIGVVYHIDLLTGSAVCFIWSRKKDGIKHVLYTYSCNIFYNVAFSGANFINMYNQQLSATVSGISNAVQSAGQLASGDIIGGITNLLTGSATAQRQYETAKPDYGRGGNSGGNSGLFSIRYPYLIQSLPIGQAPANYNKLHGIPSQIYSKLSDLTGYTEIDAINLDDIEASSAEKSELLNIMKSGFYL